MRITTTSLITILATTVAVSSAAPGTLKGQLHLVPGAGEHRLLVKFKASSRPSLDTEGRLVLGAVPLGKRATTGPLARRFTPALPDLSAGFPGSATMPRPSSDAAAKSAAPLNGLVAALAAPGAVLAEFSGLFYVEAPGMTPRDLLALGAAFEALDEVEYATLEPLQGPPPPGAVDIAPPTPDFTDRQNWLGPPPGVDCRYAWTRGARGRGVRVHDIEDSWGDLDHEDFARDSLAYGRPRFSDAYADHGIAVFGAIFGAHNGYGIDGCAPEATGRAYSFQNANGSQSRAATLVLMAEQAAPGDVILLEMQGGGLGGDNLAPADVDVAVWNATKVATDKGVVVIGTAGNGNANLDGEAYAAYRARGDNGVIMTGGGNSSNRSRTVGSYGVCCVHVQGWGHNVAAAGYSDLFKPDGDIRQGYTARFSGTSSAGAVVAAVAAALQSHALQVLKRPLAPREMRGILIATGTPQSGTQHIGPLPDLRRAILRVDSLAAAIDTTGADTSVVALRDAAGFVIAARFRAGSLELQGVRSLGVSPSYIALTDASGRIVHRIRLEAHAAERGVVRVAMPDLPAGVYGITVTVGRAVATRRIVRLP